MKFKKVAILTSKSSWFVPFSKKLVKLLKKRQYESRLFYDYGNIPLDYELIFILSYFKVIKSSLLKSHKYNMVVHESNLPKGRGWSPLFRQILEGKNRIPIVLFNAISKADAGNIYLKDWIILRGDELHDEIRALQALKTIGLCLKFIQNAESIKPKRQIGQPTYYQKRVPKDSQINLKKSLASQLNLLRIVNNKLFPAFFYYKKHKYILKVSKEG